LSGGQQQRPVLPEYSNEPELIWLMNHRNLDEEFEYDMMDFQPHELDAV
jgi:hypothetical protein